MTQERKTVFVGSLWHQNCEPFVGVAATTREKVEKMLDEASAEELESIQSGQEEDVEDDIMTGGVFEENVDELKLSPEQLENLRMDGYTYLEVP